MRPHFKLNSQNGIGALSIIVAVTALALILGGGWYAKQKGFFLLPAPLGKQCTAEAMLCPDGKTSVSRTGPNCEFAACPLSAAYQSKGECEDATGEQCHYGMCDVIPAGKTAEEVCGKDFRPGWAPIGIPLGQGDWKTYRNLQYGFEVKYPNAWCRNDIENIGGLVNFSFCPFNEIESIITLDLVCVFATGFEGELSPPKKTIQEVVYGNISFTDEKTFSGDTGRLLLRMLSFDLPERFDRCRRGAFIIGHDIPEVVLKNILSTSKFTK